MRMAELYVEAGMEVIAVVGPMISQISVALRTVLAEPSPRLFRPYPVPSRRSARFFVCGDATRTSSPCARPGRTPLIDEKT
jgi:uroporphyrinogen decarboxylase